MLKPGGKIHFGNIAPVRKRIIENRKWIERVCDVYVEVATQNPIYLSRLLMSVQLESFGDNVTLATQMATLPTLYPFIVMVKKGEAAGFDLKSSTCSTVSSNSFSNSSSNASSPIMIKLPEQVPFFEYYKDQNSSSTTVRAVTPHPSKKRKIISQVIDLTTEDYDNDSPTNISSETHKVKGRIDFNP